MRNVNTELVEEYATQLRELLPVARLAYGARGPGSVHRQASERVNALLLAYVTKGGNITHLANALGPEVISLAGLRRRLRAARGQRLTSSHVAKRGGSKDKERVVVAVQAIVDGRNAGPEAYTQAIRKVHDEGVSLRAVSEVLGVSYYTLWSAATTG